jgi:hypothetical protein
VQPQGLQQPALCPAACAVGSPWLRGCVWVN